MTSARRAAKAAGRVTPPAVAGSAAPPELLDRDAEVWHSQKRYAAYMSRLRWSLPPQERFGVPASPANRRRFAAKAWADGSGTEWDWPRLRSWGLID